MTEYTQGICEDGAAILKDGVMMTIEEILHELRTSAQLKTRLNNIEDKYDDLFDYAMECEGSNPGYMSNAFAIDFNKDNEVVSDD